jgi:uncharacterized protein
MVKMNPLSWVALVLAIIGGLNWGLVGLFNFNLVYAIFGSIAWLERLIYIVVGLAALYLAIVAAIHHAVLRDYREGETPHTPHIA